MKLKLENFRCYTNHEVEIPDHGLILLNGPSGKGKSTLLDAISYALFNNVSNPVTYEKSSCKVTLDIMNLRIIRSTRPNVLSVVNLDAEDEDRKVVEDEEAQALINKTIGMANEEFCISSYVKQGLHSSIINLPPAKQMELIKTLAYSNNEHLLYKESIKKIINKRKDNLTRLQGEIDAYDKQLLQKETFLKQHKKPVPKHLVGINANDLRTQIEQTSNKIKKNRDKLATLNSEMKNIEVVEQKNRKLEEKRSKLETEISSLENSKSKLDPYMTENQLKAMRQRYEEIEQELESKLLVEKQYLEDKERIDRLVQEHFEALNEELQTLKENKIEVPDKEQLQVEYKNAEQYHEAATKLKTLFTKVKKEHSLDKNYNTYKKVCDYLETKKQEISTNITSMNEQRTKLSVTIGMLNISGNSYECPHCQAKVYLSAEAGDVTLNKKSKPKKKDTKTLEKEKQDIDTKLESLHTNLSDIEESIKSLNTLSEQVKTKYRPLEEIQADLDEVDTLQYKYDDRKKRLASLKKQIKEEILPSSLETLMKELEEKTPSEFTENLEETIEKSKELIQSYNAEYRNAKSLKSQHENFDKDISAKKEALKKLENPVEVNKESITTEINTVNKTIDSLTKKLTEYSHTLNEYSEFDKLDMLQSEIQSLKISLKKAENHVSKLNQKYEASLKLESLYKQAESLAISKTLQSINSYAKIYLDTMFEEPIVVRLESTKLVKSTGNKKVQMNTYVQYKGHLYPNISSLSGGEFQRVSLAFLLAINDLLGSKFIFLDECTNNLDQETSTIIFNFLKEISAKKQIVVVSHEALTGIFDTVIDIQK